MTTKTSYPLARCQWCGKEGIYGYEVVDTDWRDGTGRDSIRVMCRDVEAWLDRAAENAKVRGK